jgi:spore germination cell wall hydrolase CwlJ-like protein
VQAYYQYNLVDYDQIDCLADNIYFEARAESERGQYAIAEVTMNRVNSGTFPQTVCDVVRQERNGVCQFSWWCDLESRDKAINKLIDDETYQQIKLIAFETYLLKEKPSVGTKGATFYHAKKVSKKRIGVARLEKTAVIGKHIFYRKNS